MTTKLVEDVIDHLEHLSGRKVLVGRLHDNNERLLERLRRQLDQQRPARDRRET